MLSRRSSVILMVYLSRIFEGVSEFVQLKCLCDVETNNILLWW